VRSPLLRRDLVISASTFPAFLFILIVRSRDSMFRLPSDPGYGYVFSASQDGVSAIFYGDPYFHVAARALAWIASWFPLEWQALSLALLVHLVWTICAVVISSALWLETNSRGVGVLAGLLVVTAPHASESSLGNVGNVKWPLIMATVVVCASHQYMRRHTPVVAALIIITGLTNPLLMVCLVPLVLVWFHHRPLRREALILGVITGLVSLSNFIIVGLERAASGRGSRVTAPWEDMGLFWWSGLLGPVIGGAVCLGCVLLFTSCNRTLGQLVLRLSLTAVLLHALSFRLGGIADRYFLAPMTLVFIAAIVCCVLISLSGRRMGLLAMASLAVVALIPSVKWFSAGRYLTGGPTWHSSVLSARAACETASLAAVELSTSPSGTEELNCEFVLRG
jgi:hypothetical protein